MELAKKPIRTGRWSEEEVQSFTELYPHKSNSALIGIFCRSYDAINAKAFKLRLKKSDKLFYEARRKPRERDSKGWIGVGGYRLYSDHCIQKKEHRRIFEKHNGAIPKDYCVHHKDGNKLNNNIENLELIHYKKHANKHRKYDYKKINEMKQEGFTKAKIMNKLNMKSHSSYGNAIKNGYE